MTLPQNIPASQQILQHTEAAELFMQLSLKCLVQATQTSWLIKVVKHLRRSLILQTKAPSLHKVRRGLPVKLSEGSKPPYVLSID